VKRYLVALFLMMGCEPYKPEAVEPSPTPVAAPTPPTGAAPGQGAEVEDLTASARQKAQAGDCPASRDLSERVRAIDPEYYRAFVVPDPVITRCWQAPNGSPP
jgi:hypothetical protein